MAHPLSAYSLLAAVVPAILAAFRSDRWRHGVGRGRPRSRGLLPVSRGTPTGGTLRGAVPHGFHLRTGIGDRHWPASQALRSPARRRGFLPESLADHHSSGEYQRLDPARRRLEPGAPVRIRALLAQNPGLPGGGGLRRHRRGSLWAEQAGRCYCWRHSTWLAYTKLAVYQVG